MKILHILDHSLPLHSGYVFRTMGILGAQRRRGWETVHLTSPKHTLDAPREEQIDGWHFYRTAPAAPSLGQLPVARELAQMRATARRLEEVVDQVRPDVLHAHSPVLNAFPALMDGRRHGLPVVYEIRAFWEDAAVDHGTGSAMGPRYHATRLLETKAMRRANAVTTICEGLRRDILARGLPANKVTVIPNAVDVERLQPSQAADPALVERLGLADAEVIGFIGSFYNYEGIDLLLAAAARAAVARPKLKVLLVGGGPGNERLRAKTVELGITERVNFAGRVPQEDVGRYYDLIDVLVYPRYPIRLTEIVTPLKPLEAMATGRIVLASDVGGHKELIADGKTGFLFEAGSVDRLTDALHDVFDRRSEWPAIRVEGRTFVEVERTWDRSVANYVQVYDYARKDPTSRAT